MVKFKFSVRWCSERDGLELELKAHEGSGWHDSAELIISTGSAKITVCVHASHLQAFHERLGKWLRLMSLERYAQTGNKEDLYPRGEVPTDTDELLALCKKQHELLAGIRTATVDRDGLAWDEEKKSVLAKYKHLAEGHNEQR